MRTLPLILIAALAAVPVYAQQAKGRITAKPALPDQAASAESKASPASAVAALAPGLPVMAADGQSAGRIFEIVRLPDGRVNVVLIDASDGKQRSVPGANVRFEDGQAKLNLSQAQLLALPVVQP